MPATMLQPNDSPYIMHKMQQSMLRAIHQSAPSRAI